MNKYQKTRVGTPCAHLGAVEISRSHVRCIAHRICADCGEKAVLRPYRGGTPQPVYPKLFQRPSLLVKIVTEEEYLTIERSFDVRTPEYRDRLFRLLEEAIKSNAVSLRELQQVIKNHAYVP